MVGLLWLLRPGYVNYPHIFRALLGLILMATAGLCVVWARSSIIGPAPFEGSGVSEIEGVVLAMQPQPALHREQLILAVGTLSGSGASKVRVNVPDEYRGGGAKAGDTVRAKVRLMPPAPPMLPGAYNFARTAWFSGLSATGSAMSELRVVSHDGARDRIGELRNRLAAHILDRLGKDTGGIASALASGDVGAIPESDAQAMRDAGLAHLLSISGLHVSAVIAAAYFLVLRVLALVPGIVLRARLPFLAAISGAMTGIAYTVLTGSQVPTMRSCFGALLVLAAMATGREALSLRMLAVAAFGVLLIWPEAMVGPSFQMSFAAVLAIVSLSGAQPVRRFLAPREEGVIARTARATAMLLISGIVVELALMPIGFYHFHRAGLYGAIANVIAIPLTTVVIMPAVALALVLDIAHLGAPAWWVAGQAIRFLIGLAHWVAERPGAVTLLPTMSGVAFALFAFGGLWLGLWRGAVRLWGLLPAFAGVLWLCTLQPPDILVTGDGRHVAIVEDGGRTLLTLRNTRSDYTRQSIKEIAGFSGDLRPLETWPSARCNDDFCRIDISKTGRLWRVLLSRGHEAVSERSLAAACAGADIVIADRWLASSCRPAWLLIDRDTLGRTGGLSIDLEGQSVDTVAAGQGGHGWWRPIPSGTNHRLRLRSDDHSQSDDRSVSSSAL